MRIVFLCGCLEGGRDGVGDYTALLGRELSTRGHEVLLVSINDPFCFPSDSSRYTQILPADSGPGKIRLPAALPWNERTRIFQNVLDQFKADLLSLQFVPFAFNRFGLPRKLVELFYNLRFGGERHIMFHELWVGQPDRRFSKQNLLHHCQKRVVRGLAKAYRPDLIHTNLPAHIETLRDIDLAAKPLPLFSNIPPFPRADKSSENMRKHGWFHLAFFSQFGSCDPILDFIKALKTELDIFQKELRLTFFGGNRDAAEKCRATITSRLSFNIGCEVKGPLDAVELAENLRTCDLGLSPVPRHAAGKSGSIAAFLSSGIPVAIPVCSNDPDKKAIGFFSKELASACVTKPELEAVEKARASASRAFDFISLEVVATQFESALT